MGEAIKPIAWANPRDYADYVDGIAHHFDALRYGIAGGDVPIYSAEQLATERAAREALQADRDEWERMAHQSARVSGQYASERNAAIARAEAAEAQLSALRSRCEGLVRPHIADLRRMADVFRTYEGFAATAAQCDRAADELRELLGAGDVRGLAGGEGENRE